MSTPEQIREQFAQARQRGLRARDAAEALGLSEGAAVAAHVGAPADGPLSAVPLSTEWLAQLQSLQVCGPLLALTRNHSVVHEKTGVYQNLSASGPVGIALGEEIDLRLFFNQWHAGFAVTENSGNGEPKTSLQYYDRHGTAVHKIYPREQTDLAAWREALASASAPGHAVTFDAPAAAKEPPTATGNVDVPAFVDAWAAMADTHQFFPLLRQFGLDRRQSFQLVEGRFTRRVATDAVRAMLTDAAFDGTSIMCFVGSPGCIQIHTGSVKRVEPMEIQGKTWLNVLDPGFNLHLREDLIGEVWVVEKPTDDGVVTSLEAFDADGELMTMFFGARKPGQPELTAWRDLVAQRPTQVSRATEALA